MSKSLNYFLGFVLTLSLPLTVLSQSDLKSTIPSNTIGVMTINAGSLQTKVDLDAISNSVSAQAVQETLIKELLGHTNANEDLPVFLGSLDENGINTKSNSYLYFNYEFGKLSVNYIFNISNASNFTAFVNKIIDTESSPKLNLENGEGFKFSNKNAAISWNNNVGRITVLSKNKKSSPFEYTTYAQEEGTKVNQDSIDAAKQLEELQNIEGAIDQANSTNTSKISTEAGFNASQLEKGDILFWMNNATYMNLYSEVVMKQPMLKPLIDNLTTLYKGSYTSGAFSFNKDGIKGKTKSVYSEEVMKYNKAFLKSSFESNFFKYIPKDPTFCLASSFNTNAFSSTMTGLFYPMIQEIPGYGESITDILDIVGVIIDEDALCEVFEGDMAIFMSGITNKEFETTTYEYDEEYNYTPVTKMESRVVPQITFMLSTENNEVWNKMLKLPAIANRKYKNEGKYFSFEAAGYTFYLASINNVVLFSSDETLFTQYLENGLPKGNQLASDKKKLFKKYKSLFFMNDVNDEFKNMKDNEIVAEIVKTTDFKSILATGGTIEGNSLISNFDLKMGDGSQNVINTFFSIIDKVAEIESKKKEERAVIATEEIAVPEGVEEQAIEEPAEVITEEGAE